MYKITLTLFSIAFLASSCKDTSLKKEEAATLISQYYHLPFQTKVAIDVTYGDYGWAPEKYKQLASQGIINIQPGWAGNFINPPEFKASVPQKGKQYWIQNGTLHTMMKNVPLLIFKGYEVELGDIGVGSKDTEGLAQVIFKKTNISPIQAIFDPIKETQTTMTIQFKRFDDGWKIVSAAQDKELFKPLVVPLHWMEGGEVTFEGHGD